MVKPTRPPSPCRGYKVKPNANGTWREYWEVSETLRRQGYRPAVVPLHYPDTPHGRRDCAGRCERLTAEAKVWAAAGGQFPKRAYTGTVASLIEIYESDPDSPFRQVKYNTRANYAHDNRTIRDTVGARRVAALVRRDFNKFFDKWGEPETPGGAARPWRAKMCISRLKALISYGRSIGLVDCREPNKILREMRFKGPGTRKPYMRREQMEAIRQAAHRLGLPSVARATVLQFALGLRQKDVIGEWMVDATAFPRGGKGWCNGLTWQHIDSDWILTKATTKTGSEVVHDLKIWPEVLEELGQRGTGPLVISERTGRPWAANAFGRAFRRVADAAGVPREIQSRDARAGAITEGQDAGAMDSDAAKAVGHSNPKMTARYDRSALAKSSRWGSVRQAKRLRNKD